MGTNAVLDYFYGKEADQFSFFTVPKAEFLSPVHSEAA